MPCTYYTSQQEISIAQGKAKVYKKELDKVTRILCEVMRIECTKETLLYNVPGLREWWKEHQILDKIRLQEEAKAKADKEKHLKEQAEREKKKDLQEFKRLKKKLGK